MGRAARVKRTRPKTAARSEVPPHRVRAVLFQVEVEFFDDAGRVTGRKLTDANAIYEASFFPGLADYIRGLGFTVSDYAKEDSNDANRPK